MPVRETFANGVKALSEEGAQLKRDEVHEEPPAEDLGAQRLKCTRGGTALLGEEPLRSLTDAPGDAGEAGSVAVRHDDGTRRNEVEPLRRPFERLAGGKVPRGFGERDGHAARGGMKNHEPRRLVGHISEDRCGRGEAGRRNVKRKEPGLLIFACGSKLEEELEGGVGAPDGLKERFAVLFDEGLRRRERVSDAPGLKA